MSGGLLGSERLGEALEHAMKANADGVLAIAFHTWGGLTRFANSRIHQNTWREDLSLRVTAVADGNRLGVADTHGIDASSVSRAAADAVAIARVAPPDPDFPGLAPPAAYAPADRFDEATAATTPHERAVEVARALDELSPGMEGAGYVETVADEVMIASTTGLRAYGRTTRAAVAVMAMTDTSSGYAELIENRLGALDVAAIAARSARKADLGRNPQPIEPGAYDVVLEPPCVSTMMQFLAWLGFGAKAFLEDRSFMSGRVGEKLAGDVITIVDDPVAPDALGLPFDFEGVPAQPLVLLERGVARDVVWDRATAHKAGRASTGHGLPPPNPDGPFPLNLRMEPGDASIDDLVAGVERGLLVTRFHYSNVVNEKETVLTGMTRDGTFRITDGKVAGPVQNLRYTQNTLEALSRVTGVGRDTEISSDLFFGGSRAPALRIEGFKFSSATDH